MDLFDLPKEEREKALKKRGLTEAEYRKLIGKTKIPAGKEVPFNETDKLGGYID